jgi:amino acid adenylation domain-containing protein/non-ribosomal peptide synthase protein (TIGR01720 family)
MLPETEEQQLLKAFTGIKANYPLDRTVVDLFREQVTKTPDHIAVVFEDEVLTYRELDESSDQLAWYLYGKGVRKAMIVSVIMDRSPLMLISMLGIWKAGAVYLPIDPDNALQRIEELLSDSGAGVVLSTVDTSLKEDWLQIDADWDQIRVLPAQPLAGPFPHDLAYIIYTSGSTGRPKGVMIEHRGMLNHLYAKIDLLSIDASSCVLQNAIQTFDISIWQFIVALLKGGCTVIYPQSVVLQSNLFLEKIAADKLSHVEVVPGYLQVLLEEEAVNLPDLKYLLVTGESFPKQLSISWFERYGSIPVVNAYGPTEASDDITHHVLYAPPVGVTVPLGRVVPNLRIYVLDQSGQLCAAGVRGEICVGGVGVGRGYLNDAAKTASVFVADPFVPGERMYRTGDLGYCDMHGVLGFAGRVDEQVKIRGYRIELGEIESVLAGFVKQNVVLARDGKLVGYVVVEGGFDREATMQFLRTRLPEYMVPTLWVSLDMMPQTSNGKVDRKLLPAPELSGVASYVAAVTETEKALAIIWQELLGVTQVGIHDNFFELGGDSIISIQVVSRAQRQGYSLKPRDLFEYQTLGELAANAGKTASVSAEQGILTGPVGLLPVQQHFFEQHYAVPDHYNQSVLLRISKLIPASYLSLAVSALMEHHDALRFVFKRGQEYGDRKGMLSEEHVTDITAICKKYQQSLNLENGDITRFVLLHTDDTDNRLLIVVHHLAIDGISWRILLEDLELCLTALTAGKPVDLGAKTDSYRQYQQALVHYAQQKNVIAQKDYWQMIIAASRPLPVDLVSEQSLMEDMNSIEVILEPTLTNALLTAANRAYQTEINDILLSALVQTISGWSGNDGVVITLEGHGREAINEHVNISRTVGWFTNLYPVLLSNNNSSAGDLIKSVKEQLRRVPGKGIGYSALRYLHSSERLAESSSGILFNYLGQLDNLMGSSRWLFPATEDTGATISGKNHATANLIINAYVSDGRLQLNWNYSTKVYLASTITILAEQYLHHLQKLITHCQLKEITEHTPSDFGLQEKIGYEELDAFFNNRDSGNQIDIFEF